MIAEEELMSRVAEALGVERDSIQPTTKATDIEAWDSMGTMMIVMLLSDEFGIKLEPQETSRLQSVESIIKLMREAGKLA